MKTAAKKTGRARKAGQGSKWCNPATRLALYARDGFCCIYCGATADDGAMLTLDHITACENGGTNAPENLITACRSCNSAKQDLSPRAWGVYCKAKGIKIDWKAVRRQAGRTLDRAEGRRLLALRNAAKA
jgi:hypothetical protein